MQTVFIGFAYVTWMTSFTETVEAHNSGADRDRARDLGMAGAARGDRVLPMPAVGGEVGDAADRGAILHRGLPAGARESRDTAGPAAGGARRDQGRRCSGTPRVAEILQDLHRGVVVFIATIFVMRGRWSPAAARADEVDGDATVARELHALQGS